MIILKKMTPDILIFGLRAYCKILNNGTESPAASVLREAEDISNLGPISSQLFILVPHGAG